MKRQAKLPELVIEVSIEAIEEGQLKKTLEN